MRVREFKKEWAKILNSSKRPVDMSQRANQQTQPQRPPKKFMTAGEVKNSAKILRKTREKIEVTAEMLLAPDGLSQLADNFEKVHKNMSYSKGSEFHNLNLLLKEYEAWAVQVCPSLDVDTFVNRCEKLSNHEAIRQHLDDSNGRQPKKKKGDPLGGPKKRGKKNQLGEVNEIQEENMNENLNVENNQDQVELELSFSDDEFEGLFKGSEKKEESDEKEKEKEKEKVDDEDEDDDDFLS